MRPSFVARAFGVFLVFTASAAYGIDLSHRPDWQATYEQVKNICPLVNEDRTGFTPGHGGGVRCKQEAFGFAADVFYDFGADKNLHAVLYDFARPGASLSEVEAFIKELEAVVEKQFGANKSAMVIAADENTPPELKSQDYVYYASEWENEDNYAVVIFMPGSVANGQGNYTVSLELMSKVNQGGAVTEAPSGSRLEQWRTRFTEMSAGRGKAVPPFSKR